MNTTPTKVLVVSDHDVVRAGLAALFAGVATIQVVDDSRPDFARHESQVALYDVIGLHEGDGADLDRLVRNTGLAVLAVSRDLRPDLADRAFERGVDGCVSSGSTADQFVTAVEMAAWGQLCGDVTPGAPDLTINPAAAGRDVGLTDREAQVIAQITIGRSNDEIARSLYLSINSVKTYIRSAYRKMGVNSRSQAVRWGIRSGFDPGFHGADEKNGLQVGRIA